MAFVILYAIGADHFEFGVPFVCIELEMKLKMNVFEEDKSYPVAVSGASQILHVSWHANAMSLSLHRVLCIEGRSKSHKQSRI